MATLIALAPALMVAAGWIGSATGLMDPQFGLGVLAYQWAPKLALASVAAGVFGIIVALVAGFSRFWIRALLVLAITTITLLAYVWDRQQPPAQPAALEQAQARR